MNNGDASSKDIEMLIEKVREKVLRKTGIKLDLKLKLQGRNKLKKENNLVILGGHSKEREISLKTGQSCINALKKLNYKIIKFDPKFSS